MHGTAPRQSPSDRKTDGALPYGLHAAGQLVLGPLVTGLQRASGTQEPVIETLFRP